MTVLNEIVETFCKKLSESEGVDGATVDALRDLFKSEKKLRADDLVGILSRAQIKVPK